MIDYKKLKIIGYMNKNKRQILINYEDTTEVIEFEDYQSEGVLNTTTTYLKEFYRTGDKSIIKNIPKAVQINKNTFYRMTLPNGFKSYNFI